MKSAKIWLLIMAVWCSANPAFTQTWTPTSAPSKKWQAVASSADGSKLVAISGGAGAFGGVYTSTNSGVTWIQQINPATNMGIGLISVASSADGNKLAATALNTVYTSTNAGITWASNSIPGTNLISIASSADGNKLVVVVGSTPAYGIGLNGFIYVSTNSGAAWTQTSAPSKIWSSVASSADGTKLVAVSMDHPANAGWIYTSTNSGGTWTQADAPTNQYWTSVASSVDGSKLAAANLPVGTFVGGNFVFVSFGVVYTSTNYGATWVSNNVPNTSWQAVVSSADGTKLAATDQNRIYTSTNSGTAWRTNNVTATPCWAMASSADGNRLVLVVNQGGIYTSQTTPSPQLNLAPTPTNLTLAWTIPSTNFVLQQSSNLVLWTDVTNAPTLNLTNLQNQITFLPSNTNNFYRLKTP